MAWLGPGVVFLRIIAGAVFFLFILFSPSRASGGAQDFTVSARIIDGATVKAPDRASGGEPVLTISKPEASSFQVLTDDAPDVGCRSETDCSIYLSGAKGRPSFIVDFE